MCPPPPPGHSLPSTPVMAGSGMCPNRNARQADPREAKLFPKAAYIPLGGPINKPLGYQSHNNKVQVQTN